MDRLSFLLLWLVVAAAGLPAARADAAPRIVSLAPHLTELLYAAGAGDRLVGTTEFSDHPPAALDLPRIGDAHRFDYEGIVGLAPDLAVAWESGTPRAAVERLESLGIAVVAVRTDSLADIAAAITMLGQLAGTPEPAAAATTRLREAIAALGSANAGREPLRVFVEIDDRPLYTVSGRHLISEVVSLCGGRNVFADLGGIAPAVDLEAVIARDPQVILSTVGDGDPSARWRRWNSMDAVRHGEVHAVAPDELTRPSPRIVDGAREVCAVIAGVRQRLAR